MLVLHDIVHFVGALDEIVRSLQLLEDWNNPAFEVPEQVNSYSKWIPRKLQVLQWSLII